jgi:hypothetical protein
MLFTKLLDANPRIQHFRQKKKKKDVSCLCRYIDCATPAPSVVFVVLSKVR